MDASIAVFTSLRSVDKDARAARAGEVGCTPDVGRIFRPRLVLKLVQRPARLSHLLLKCLARCSPLRFHILTMLMYRWAEVAESTILAHGAPFLGRQVRTWDAAPVEVQRRADGG